MAADGPFHFVSARALATAIGLVSLLGATDGAFARSKPQSVFPDPFASVQQDAIVLPRPARPDTMEPPAPVRFFTLNDVLRKRQASARQGSLIRLASLGPIELRGSFSDLPSASVSPRPDEPFGLATFRAPEGHLWVKWRGVKADVAAENSVFARCRASRADCPSRGALDFLSLVDKARTQQGRARLAFVNREVNAAIRYTSDMAQHGRLDVWSAPIDSFRTHQGDCKSYAIAKYVALREAGIPASDLRLMIVRVPSIRLDHAVVAARNNGGWVILDNRRAEILEDLEAREYQPLFSLDDRGVNLLAAPYAARALRDAVVTPAAAATVETHSGGSPLPYLI